MKGPKAILSSALATALDEFFVVDKDSIESNLLVDAKIVLHDIELRPIKTTLPSKAVAEITGGAAQVVFSWSWGMAGSTSGWVKDATLLIKSLQATIILCEPTSSTQEDTSTPEKPNESPTPSATEAIEQAAQQHDEAGEIQKQGGIAAYIQQQVKMIIDSLKVQVHDFSLTIVLPKRDWDHDSEAISIVVAGDSLDVVSLGRMVPNDPKALGNLQQELIFQNFYSYIVKDESNPRQSQKDMGIVKTSKTTPLLDPFSYTVQATRTGGNRFDSLSANLKFVGGQCATPKNEQFTGDIADKDSSQLSTPLGLHLGALQITTICHVSVLFLAPPEAVKEESKAQSSSKSSHIAAADNNKSNDTDGPKDDKSDAITHTDPPSTFDFGLTEFVLELDDLNLKLPNARFQYCADGTVMQLSAQGFHVNGSKVQLAVAGLTASFVSPMTLEFDTVQEFLVVDTLKLSKPTEHIKLIKEGQTYTIEMDTIEAELLKGKETDQEVEEQTEEAKDQDNKTENATIDDASSKEEEKSANSGPALSAPFPIVWSMKSLQLTKEADEGRTEFTRLNLYVNPTELGTQIAIDLGSFQSHLLGIHEAQVFALADKAHQFSNLRVSTQQVQVTAGHSSQDWQAAFALKKTAKNIEHKEKKTKEHNEKVPKEKEVEKKPNGLALWKLPNSYVDPLKLTIAWKGTGVSVQDTKVTVKAFHGKEDTTAKDLIFYYTSSCLARVSDFIPNAQVLGLNVVDSTVGTWGALVGMATPLGPLGGVAALSAIDGVKASIAAGKKSRNVDDGAETSPIDVFRGIAYTIHENTEAAGGNPLRILQNVASTTGQYVNENKARLGGAGIGGAGMILGGLLGGPVGAIAAGLASQAIASKTIDHLEEGRQEKTK